MTIRDLGYRGYEGDRLSPSHNTLVLLRHGIKRAWASWLVKIAIFCFWIPMLCFGFRTLVDPVVLMTFSEDPAPLVRGILSWELYTAVVMISIGAGAGVIAEDFQNRAFQFYFAKPVTAVQYLAGRTAAVAFWCFWPLFIPALLVVLAIVGLSSPEVRLERTGLLLPALLQSLLTAVVVAAVSVGISALSKSRALTMTSWMIVFFVPLGLGLVVHIVALAVNNGEGDGWPWLLLTSVPWLIGTVADSLFKVPTGTQLEWYHAAPILLAVTIGAVAFAWRRLQRAEVVT